LAHDVSAKLLPSTRSLAQMATFIRVTRDNSGEIIYVNMDKIISIERSQNYTLLKPENNQLTGVTVKETPVEIIDLIYHEKKMQT
jgi:hypothetical protein